jgi:ATP-dependent protease Clp ATPase subunit
MFVSVTKEQPIQICSFCGNRESDVNKILRGVIPRACICDACVYLCISLLIEHHEQRADLATRTAGSELTLAVQKFKGATRS